MKRLPTLKRGMIEGAVHLPLTELPARLTELPDGAGWAHRGSGYRAAAAAALLANAGRRVVLIDDEFDRAASADIAIVGGD